MASALSGDGIGDEQPAEEDASRRTRLASERTQLAWWRTGLTALAVGIGVGRLIPELGEDLTEWPYVVLGVGFAAYGVVLIWYGSLRGRAIEAALARGGFAALESRLATALPLAGVALGVATGVLIVLG